MKYNTIGTMGMTNNTDGGRKPSLTIYADMDLTTSDSKIIPPALNEIELIRNELEIVQKALKVQTRRCRQLVAEYTRRLQLKEQQYQSEKSFRHNQLAKVLRALLIFEARLRQEQKFISYQLEEKDCIIQKQSAELKNLLLQQQYCKNCNQYYSTTSINRNPMVESSFDSSSDQYVLTTEYQSSMESNSDVYATVSEKSFNLTPVSDADSEPLKVDSAENKLTQEINLVSDRIEGMFNNVVKNTERNPPSTKNTPAVPSDSEFHTGGDAIEVNWYASTSDCDDDDQRSVYRNNPVLECMNQILLQDMDDSPPKTPSIDRKQVHKGKKTVKFSDEEDVVSNCKTQEVTEMSIEQSGSNQSEYYETPIQQVPNFYETPQSVCSNNNDYEQILSQASSSSELHNTCSATLSSPTKNSSGISMSRSIDQTSLVVVVPKKKLPPPALPPKPPNLLSKCKLTVDTNATATKDLSNTNLDSTESEADYCSISELNLPTTSATDESITPVQNLVKKCVEKLNLQLAKETSIRSERTSQSLDTIIPKLPQVSEIIIPDDNVESCKDQRITHDNYVKNNTQSVQQQPVTDTEAPPSSKSSPNRRNRRQIVIGTSVSDLITAGLNPETVLENNINMNIVAPVEQIVNKLNMNDTTNLDEIQTLPVNGIGTDCDGTTNGSSNFVDLTENFEEFKLDDCDVEEYSVDDVELSSVMDEDTKKEKKISTVCNPLSQRNSSQQQIAGENNSNVAEKLVPPFKRHYWHHPPSYDHFLECSGLSTKSILTPSRLLSNHKGMLKPKDVKLRSKVRTAAATATNFMVYNHLVSNGTTKTATVKYWSEPYI